jgi:small subunit ribosomal protein S3
VIGRKGAEVDKLREELQLLTKKEITLNIMEVKKPELDAKLVADSIARQLEERISFRRCMKKAIVGSMKMGAEGIKIVCSGRLGGAEIARSEKYMDGRVPLHTLRADIDYATSTANTTYGTIGVKVWICRGEILDRPSDELAEDTAQQEMHQKKQMQPPRKRRPRPKSRVRKKRHASADADREKAIPEEAHSRKSQSAKADNRSPGDSSGKAPDRES